MEGGNILTYFTKKKRKEVSKILKRLFSLMFESHQYGIIMPAQFHNVFSNRVLLCS
jgi:hypothetical protein